MKKKIYIFDLDHTLINSRQLKKDLELKFFNAKKISSEKIWDFFQKNTLEGKNFLNKKNKKYLFENVEENLKKIKDEKILLTYGDLNFQKEKIVSLGLEKIFDKIIFTEKNKIIFLEDFFEKNKEREIICINDIHNKKFCENKNIKIKIPEITILEIDNYSLEENRRINFILEKIIKN